MTVFNLSLWISNLPDFANVDKVEFGPFILIPLALSCLIISELGFGFYLWYLYRSPDHYPKRLLNILYGYLSFFFLGAGLCATTVILLMTFRFPMWQPVLARLNAALASAVSLTFLLISYAAALSHFKPNLYLEISLRWKNKIVMPVLFIIVIFMENLLNLSCVGSDDMSHWHCEGDNLRVRVTIPATVASFFGQLVVVVDDICGWKKILTVLRGFFIKFYFNPYKNTVAPAPENNSEPPNNPTNAEPNLFAV